MIHTTSTSTAAQALALRGEQAITEVIAAMAGIRRGFALVPPKEYKLHPDDLPALRAFASFHQMPPWGNEFLPDLLGLKIVLDKDTPRLPRKEQAS